MAGSATIMADVDGTTRIRVGPLTIAVATPIGEVDDIALAAGDNVIDVPATASVAVIEPASSNTMTHTLKGDPGDVGIIVSSTTPYVLSPLSSTFVIEASDVGDTITITWL